MTANLSTDSRREELLRNLHNVRERIRLAAERVGRDPSDITLLAVTKTMPPEDINVLLESGVTRYGENRVQELMDKQPRLLSGEAHFIGTLQRNKVKYLIGRVSLIQSVGSRDVLREIEKRAAKADTVVNVLLEINIGEEEQKSGFLPHDLPAVLQEIPSMPHVFVRGLMAVPPKTDSISADDTKIRGYFEKMNHLFIDNRTQKDDNIDMSILSMGMSHDFETAIACGSTMVRVGTGLFGNRPYPTTGDGKSNLG